MWIWWEISWLRILLNYCLRNVIHDFFSHPLSDQILNYTIDKENSQIIPYFYGDSKEILLYFETRNNTVQEVEFELMIGDALINSSSIVINQSEAKVKTIHLPLHRLLQDIPFGNHSMNMTLFAQNRTEVNGLIVQLYYEEKITGLQVCIYSFWFILLHIFLKLTENLTNYKIASYFHWFRCFSKRMLKSKKMSCLTQHSKVDQILKWNGFTKITQLSLCI